MRTSGRLDQSANTHRVEWDQRQIAAAAMTESLSGMVADRGRQRL